jgi:hypothetical protein
VNLAFVGAAPDWGMAADSVTLPANAADHFAAVLARC